MFRVILNLTQSELSFFDNKEFEQNIKDYMRADGTVTIGFVNQTKDIIFMSPNSNQLDIINSLNDAGVINYKIFTNYQNYKNNKYLFKK